MSGVDPSSAPVLKLVLLAAGRKQVPSETAVAGGALENQYRRIGYIADMVTDAEFNTHVCFSDLHPIVQHQPSFARAAAAPDPHVANVLAREPVAGVVDEVLIFLLLLHDRSQFFEIAEVQHVGLAHQDVDLGRLGHVRRLAVGLWQV